jgi:DNA-binding transcriptional LysR family regulator
MDTRQLAALCAVVERGSFSQAAESLGVTQSAVSQAVRALEQRLGVALIDRSGRRAEPTAEGRAVVARAQRILALERDMVRAAQEEADVLRGRLAIGASTGPGSRLVPRLLVGFLRQNAEVEVALEVGATHDIAQRVLAHELELGVVGAEKPHRSLVYEPFRADEIVLALPPGHPRAGGELSLEELAREPLIVQQDGSGVRAIVETELRRLGLKPRDLNVVAELGLQESSQTAVEEGLGATFTSLAAIERELELGRMTSARVAGLSLRRDYVVVRQAAREPSRLAAAFVAFCREA